MKKTSFYYLLSGIVVSLLLACGNGNSSKIDKDVLLKNKFLGDEIVLTFENETNYKIAGSMSGCGWSNEGTYEIDGEKVLLHPTKCEDFCQQKEPLDPCKTTLGEAVCTLREIEGTKKLHVQSLNYDGFDGDYTIVDINPCAEIKEEQDNVGNGPTEIDGNWMGVDDDSKEMMKYEDGRWVVCDSTGQEIGPDGQYKISNIEMIDECLADQTIKSLKKGKYLTTSNVEGSCSSSEYKIEGDILTIRNNKYKRVE